jgi:hypothetical protein
MSVWLLLPLCCSSTTWSNAGFLKAAHARVDLVGCADAADAGRGGPRFARS